MKGVDSFSLPRAKLLPPCQCVQKKMEKLGETKSSHKQMTTVRFKSESPAITPIYSPSVSPSAHGDTPEKENNKPMVLHAPNPTLHSKRSQPSKAFRRSAGERALFRRGDRVEDIEGYKGSVAWIGWVCHGDIRGEYVGVVWEEGAERGHLDGMYKGVRYFKCEPQCGSLCTSSQLRLHKGCVTEANIMRERHCMKHALIAMASRMSTCIERQTMARYLYLWVSFCSVKHLQESRQLYEKTQQSMQQISLLPPAPTREVHCYCALM